MFPHSLKTICSFLTEQDARISEAIYLPNASQERLIRLPSG